MVNNWLRQLSFQFIPGTCVLCMLPSHCRQDLCAACEIELPWLGASCTHCGVPLATIDALCGDCLKNPPDFDRCYSAWQYQQPLSHLIRRIKYQRQTQPLPLLCHLLAKQLRHHYARQPLPELIVATPLHWRRLLMRGFNQADIIARHLASSLNLPYQRHALSRKIYTTSQSSLSVIERRQNLRHAFRCKNRFDGKSVALVDDIVTTGATANELSKLLKRAGATQVHVWCLARTPIN